MGAAEDYRENLRARLTELRKPDWLPIPSVSLTFDMAGQPQAFIKELVKMMVSTFAWALEQSDELKDGIPNIALIRLRVEGSKWSFTFTTPSARSIAFLKANTPPAVSTEDW